MPLYDHILALKFLKNHEITKLISLLSELGLCVTERTMTRFRASVTVDSTAVCMLYMYVSILTESLSKTRNTS